MNIEEVKKRLNRLQNKQGANNSYSDYAASFWKPKAEEGKQVIRIVPYKHNKDFPFVELYFHFNVGKQRMLALSNFGEADPIMELTNELRRSNDSEMKELAKNLSPKVRIFAPVIVRGEEDKGVRFWEFGKQVYMDLLGVMSDEDYGNITDIVSGRDITIEVTREKGKLYDSTFIRVKPNTSPLHESSKMVEDFLENQKELINIYKKYSFDEMKSVLQNHMISLQGETVEKTHVEKRSLTSSNDIDELFEDED
jgi:hypothetical protein